MYIYIYIYIYTYAEERVARTPLQSEQRVGASAALPLEAAIVTIGNDNVVIHCLLRLSLVLVLVVVVVVVVIVVVLLIIIIITIDNY